MPARESFCRNLWQGNVTHKQMLILLMGIWVILVLTHLTPCAKTDTDTGANLTLAKSLADGKGFKIGGNFCRVFPPLFPMALSLAHRLNLPGYVWEKFVVMMSALGAILCSYLFLRLRYRGRELVILTLLIAVSPALLEYSFQIRPDVPFTFFVLVFLVASALYWRAPKINWTLGLVAAVALPLATLTRTAGVALYAASAVWLMRVKLWRTDARRCIVFAVLILVIACPPLFGWVGWLNHHKEEGTGSYANMFTSHVPQGNHPLSIRGVTLLANRWAEKIPQQVYGGARSLMSSGKGVPAIIWTCLVVPVLLLGLTRRTREAEFQEYCFCIYSLMILFWPSPQGVRFWLPVLPLTWGYAADGVKMLGTLAEKFPRLGRQSWFRRSDEFLGRLRVKGIRWAVVFLLALALVYSSIMVVESWRDCGKAINYLVLGRTTAPVVRFLEARHEERTVLAYWRGFEVQPALTNPRVRVVTIDMRADDDVASLMTRMSEQGITHLVIELTNKNKDPHIKRGRLLRQVKDRLLADASSDWVAENTGRVIIFDVPPAEYWSAESSIEAGPGDGS